MIIPAITAAAASKAMIIAPPPRRPRELLVEASGAPIRTLFVTERLCTAGAADAITGAATMDIVAAAAANFALTFI